MRLPLGPKRCTAAAQSNRAARALFALVCYTPLAPIFGRKSRRSLVRREMAWSCMSCSWAPAL